MPSKLSYVICTAPRSGSELLCEHLRETRLFGSPQEYLHRHSFPVLFKSFGVTCFNDYLAKILSRPVFAVKMHGGGYFRETIADLRDVSGGNGVHRSRVDLLESLSPGLKYIWLTRRSKVRQAISFSRALQSGRWQSHVEPTAGSERAPIYSGAAINRALERIVMMESDWQEYFDEAGAAPLTLVYEDFVRDPKKMVRAVAEFLEVPFREDFVWPAIKPRMRKLAGDETEQWLERFHGERRGLLDDPLEELPAAEHNARLVREQFVLRRTA